MQLHPPKAAQSLTWTPGIALLKWWDLVKLRRYWLLGDRLIYRVGKMDPSQCLGTLYGWCSKSYSRFWRGITKEACYIFSDKLSVYIYLIVHLASQDLQLEPKEDAFEKQIAGWWHVVSLQEASEYDDHDILTVRFHVTHYTSCAILFNKGHLSPQRQCQVHLPSWHQARTCLIKSWKKNRDGPCKNFTCLIS